MKEKTAVPRLDKFHQLQATPPARSRSFSARETPPHWRVRRINSLQTKAKGQDNEFLFVQSARSSVKKPSWNTSVRIPDTPPAVRVVTHIPGEHVGFREFQTFDSKPGAFKRQAKKSNAELKEGDTLVVEPEEHETAQPPQKHTGKIRYMERLTPALLVTCSEDGCAVMIRTDSNHTEEEQFIRVFAGHSGPILHCSQYDDSSLVTCGEDGTVRLWKIQDPGSCRVFRGHEDGVTKVRGLSQFNEIVSASRDGTIRVWNVATGQEKVVLDGVQGRISQLFLLPNLGFAVAVVTSTGMIKVWNKSTGQVDLEMEQAEMFNCADVDERESSICIGCKDGSLLNYYFRHDEKDQLTATISSCIKAEGCITCVKYGEKQFRSFVVVGHASGDVSLYDLRSSSMLGRTSAHGSWVLDMAVLSLQSNLNNNAPEDEASHLVVASACFDGSVALNLMGKTQKQLFSKHVHSGSASQVHLVPQISDSQPSKHSKKKLRLYSGGADGRLVLSIV